MLSRQKAPRAVFRLFSPTATRSGRPDDDDDDEPVMLPDAPYYGQDDES